MYIRRSIYSREMFADSRLSWLKARLKFFGRFDSRGYRMAKSSFRLRNHRHWIWIKHAGLSNSIGKMCAFAFVMRIQIRGVSPVRHVCNFGNKLFTCINTCAFIQLSTSQTVGGIPRYLCLFNIRVAAISSVG